MDLIMLLCALYIYIFHLNSAVYSEAKCLVDNIYCIKRSKHMLVVRREKIHSNRLETKCDYEK